MSKKNEPRENLTAPRFVAVCADEFVEAGDDLTELLHVLVGLVDPGSPEDLAVWDGCRLAAVVLADGTVHVFQPAREQTPAATGQEKPCRP